MKRLVATLLLLSLPVTAGERLLITDVRLSGEADSPRVSLILEHGRIAGIINDRTASLPGVRSYSGEGRWVTPAFVDAWTSGGVDAPAIVRDRDRKPNVTAEIMPEMRSANRKGIRASFSVANGIAFDEDALSSTRAEGFGTLHLAPTGELLGGKSAVISAADAAARDQVIAEDVYQCAAFRASGTGYPSTLMGYHAQLRQFFLDSKWEADLRERWDSGRPGPRPAFDPDLREGEAVLSGERKLLCEADSDDDILRWLRLADEWGVEIAIVGGREAWRVANVLRERGVPVFLTLDWGDEVDDPDEDSKSEEDEEPAESGEDSETSAPEETEEPAESEEPVEEPSEADEEEAAPENEEASDDEEGSVEEGSVEEEISWEYTEPLAVRREKRSRWEEDRDGALRLQEAGVNFAFCSGKSSAEKMLEKVRTLVEIGLPAEAALSALTADAAALLGLEGRVGAIKEGAIANLCIWAGEPLAKKPRLAAVIVDGVLEELDIEEDEGGEAPNEDIELDGTWEYSFTNSDAGSISMKIEMSEDGAVKGEITVQNRFMEEPQTEKVSGRVSGKKLTLSSELDIEGFVVELEFEGEVKGDTYEGEVAWTFSGGSTEDAFTAKRKPGQREEVQR
jgi:imidazolonepropionase-like amidohydrolase